MQEKTLFQFRNMLERKQQCFVLRTENDKEDVEMVKVRWHELYVKTEEENKQAKTELQKEVDTILAQKDKIISEINEKRLNKIKAINAETDLKYNEIIAEVNLIETDLLATGKAQAARTRAEAEGYAVKIVSQAEMAAAPLIAQAIEMEGQAESEMLKGYAAKRRHIENLERLKSIDTLSNQPCVPLFSKEQDYLMALMAQKDAFEMIPDDKKRR